MNYSKVYLGQAATYCISENSFDGEITWKCPSNIALVKYWGKYGEQLPKNSSLSFTLLNSYSTTCLSFRSGKNRGVQHIAYSYDDKVNEAFAPRVREYFRKIEKYLSFLTSFDVSINSVNTFPHSAGIASSASFFGSLALCLVEMEERILGKKLQEPEFYTKASFLARLGSGSASRSIYGGYTCWGKNLYIPGSSDEVAISINENIHPVFHDFNDIVLLLDEGQKKISSSAGHALMHTNPYAETRFKQAGENSNALLEALHSGDLERFTSIVENEALSLHAMMLTSWPGFFLIKPATLEVIEKVRDFRNGTKVPLAFTLDAGPNVHLLFPDSFSEEVHDFVVNSLINYSPGKKFIEDRVGQGPIRVDK